RKVTFSVVVVPTATLAVALSSLTLAQGRADGVAFDAIRQAPQGHDRSQRLGGIGRDGDVVQVDHASTLIDARALVNKG
ncbi:hypothetical protein, partial [Klebsiella pneumoniae]|uniref:hypothetical protein n=1 Tax=Klebsiella pneumoniae TaxID=573 RepID=UPI0027316C85